MISSYVGENAEFERQFLSGELEVELTPQVKIFMFPSLPRLKSFVEKLLFLYKSKFFLSIYFWKGNNLI